MKANFLIFLVMICLLFSCARRIRGDTDATDFDDLVYTDSFSPAGFEAPLSRKVIRMQDVDIGFLIDPDAGNPQRRILYLAVSSLFQAIAKKENLETCFTPSAYNSFYLRYGNPLLPKRYRLRVGIPDGENGTVLWISYKILLKSEVYIGRLELTKKGNEYSISDFEYHGLDELFLADEEKS